MQTSDEAAEQAQEGVAFARSLLAEAAQAASAYDALWMGKGPVPSACEPGISKAEERRRRRAFMAESDRLRVLARSLTTRAITVMLRPVMQEVAPLASYDVAPLPEALAEAILDLT